MECGFNQRYCGTPCAGLARAESKRAAQLKYRRSEAGREQHNAEERARRRRQQIRVGDQFVAAALDGGMVADMEAHRSEPTECPAPPSVPPSDVPVEWSVVVAPELGSSAEEMSRSGVAVMCACCRRVGPIMRVVVKRESRWLVACRELRRQQRAGAGP